MRDKQSLQSAVADANASVSANETSQDKQHEGSSLSSSARLGYQLAQPTGPCLHAAFTGRALRVFRGLLPIFLLTAATPAWTQEADDLIAGNNGSHCSDPNVEIQSHMPEDRTAACAGAIIAKAFLEACGMNTDGRVRISMVTEFADATLNAFGYFDRKSDRVYVLNFEAARKAAEGVGIYGEAMDHHLHRSIVVHEVAHLIANRNFLSDAPLVAAHEYIAYVSQFATLPSAIRDRILSNNPGSGFTANWQINSFDLKFAPNQFGVRAYQHFTRPENGPAFLRGVLSGEIQVGIPLPL